MLDEWLKVGQLCSYFRPNERALQGGWENWESPLGVDESLSQNQALANTQRQTASIAISRKSFTQRIMGCFSLLLIRGRKAHVLNKAQTNNSRI